MISPDEIRRIARAHKMPAGVIEKDYALTWLLYGIYSSDIGNFLVFKGGTALKKAYFPVLWRLSEDLDFTLKSEISAEEIRNLLGSCFGLIGEKTGMIFSTSSFHANPEHIIASVQYAGPLGKNSIRIDISMNEKIITPAARKPINAEYSDAFPFEVVVYSLDEILAEKLRSILQRGKSRDYFDVWALLKNAKFDKNKMKELFAEKCRIKNIAPEYNLFFENTRIKESQRFWKTGLERLVKELPDFETVIDDLKKELRFLKE